jgi:hypothetical protein
MVGKVRNPHFGFRLFFGFTLVRDEPTFSKNTLGPIIKPVLYRRKNRYGEKHSDDPKFPLSNIIWVLSVGFTKSGIVSACVIQESIFK